MSKSDSLGLPDDAVELIARTLFEESGRNWDIQPDGVKSRWLKRGRLVVSALEATK